MGLSFSLESFVYNYTQQIDHFQEHLKGPTTFVEVACAKAGPLAAYLVQLYFTIVTNCIKKHSACPQSEEVCREVL